MKAFLHSFWSELSQCQRQSKRTGTGGRSVPSHHDSPPGPLLQRGPPRPKTGYIQYTQLIRKIQKNKSEEPVSKSHFLSPVQKAFPCNGRVTETENNGDGWRRRTAATKPEHGEQQRQMAAVVSRKCFGVSSEVLVCCGSVIFSNQARTWRF
jgi:hypothetical protein